MTKLLKRSATEQKAAKKTSTLYAEISAGLFPPPVRIGKRSVAWLESEVDAVIAARISGCGDDQIRILIRLLVDKRSSAMNGGGL